MKFKVGSKQLYRSKTVFKNLNPKWDETFLLPIENVHRAIAIKVFDYDRGLYDDAMGNAILDISQMEFDRYELHQSNYVCVSYNDCLPP